MYVRNDSTDYGIGFGGVTFAEPGDVLLVEGYEPLRAARAAIRQNPNKFSEVDEATYHTYLVHRTTGAYEVQNCPLARCARE